MTRLTLIAALLLAGCSTVKVYDANGNVTVKRNLGIIKIEAATPEETPVTMDVKGVGFMVMPWGFLAGWSQSDITFLPTGACVLIVRPNIDPEIWIDTLKKETVKC